MSADARPDAGEPPPGPVHGPGGGPPGDGTGPRGRRLVPLLLMLPMLAILLALGTWQLERRAWKADLLERIEAGLRGPAAPLPADIGDPAGWEWRRVTVEGRFDHAAEMRLLARTHEGRVGIHLVTPLLRPEGPPVLIDRGWVPETGLTASDAPGETPAAAIARPEGPVTVEGVARLPAGPGWMQPDNDPPANRWFWIDLTAMAEAAGLDAVAPLLIEALPGGQEDVGQAANGPEAYPTGIAPRVDLPNNHLQYAITWYAFAAILIAIFLVDRRSDRRRRR